MLPARWRKEHGIQPEAELLVELRDNCLTLQTREQAVREAQEMVRRLVPAGKSLVDELLEQRRREALEERRVVAPGRLPEGGSSSEHAATVSGGTRPKRRRARARR
jgi:triphosphoribosyl-dephospho-CoA synthetase